MLNTGSPPSSPRRQLWPSEACTAGEATDLAVAWNCQSSSSPAPPSPASAEEARFVVRPQEATHGLTGVKVVGLRGPFNSRSGVAGDDGALGAQSWRPPMVASAEGAVGEVVSAAGWWSERLVVPALYLCVLVCVVVYTETVKMAMVPITIFLIVLSLLLFFFILFCVCFVVFL